MCIKIVIAKYRILLHYSRKAHRTSFTEKWTDLLQIIKSNNKFPFDFHIFKFLNGWKKILRNLVRRTFLCAKNSGNRWNTEINKKYRHLSETCQLLDKMLFLCLQSVDFSLLLSDNVRKLSQVTYVKRHNRMNQSPSKKNWQKLYRNISQLP